MLAENTVHSAWVGAPDAVDASVQAFPEFLVGIPIWQLVFFVVLGLISLLYGLKLFKGMIVIYAAMAGVVVGGAVAVRFGAPGPLGSVVGAVVLAALAWPLLKVAVSIFGGIAGGLLGAMCALWLNDPVYVLIGGLVGLVLGFVLGFLLFRGVIVFTTAVLGALLVVLGIFTKRSRRGRKAKKKNSRGRGLRRKATRTPWWRPCCRTNRSRRPSGEVPLRATRESLRRGR